MVDKSVEQLELIYNGKNVISYPIKRLHTLELDDIVDCFRGWVQKVQLLSMDNKKIK